jgi:hypothetical protein
MRIGPLLATVTLVGMKGMVAWGGCWSDKTPVTPLRTRRRNRIRPSARADCRCVAAISSSAASSSKAAWSADPEPCHRPPHRRI